MKPQGKSRKSSRIFVDGLFSGISADLSAAKAIDGVSDTFDPKLELDLVKLVREAVDPNTKLIRDLRIDDRDFPEFPNYYEFVAGARNGLKFKPFSRQLWAVLQLFQEICPRCSNPKYNGDILDVPLKLKAPDFQEHYQLLVNGKCPKCKATRLDLLRAKELFPYHEISAMLGQRSGKCVTGETLILTDSGLVEIKDLFHSDTPYGFSDVTETFIVDESGAYKEVDRLYKSKKQPLLSVTTGIGTCITGTPNHPLLTLYGFKQLKELAVGDVMPVYMGQNRWAKTAYSLKEAAERAIARRELNKKTSQVVHSLYSGPVTEDIARLFGYYIAEGNCSNYSITNHDENVLRDCQKTLGKLFGRVPTIEKSHWVRLTTVAEREYIECATETSTEVRSREKAIPSCILRSPKNVVAAFLSALFEGDGGADSSGVYYSTTSYKLASQIQMLLLNFGIPCSLGTKKFKHNFKTLDRRCDYVCYSVGILGLTALEKFQTVIGFQSERKRKILGTNIKRRQRNPDVHNVPWYDKLPVPLRSHWIELIGSIKDHLDEKAPKFSSGLHHFFGSDIYGLARRLLKPSSKDLALTRERVRRVATALLAKHRLLTTHHKEQLRWFLKMVNDERLFFTTVSRIEAAPSDVTYDVSVPDGHRFIGNGLVNHNTTMFVSPAVVYLLHRMMKLQRPYEVYGLNPTTLVGTLVAQTFQNAYEQLWLPVKTYIESCDWFCVAEGTLIAIADGTFTPIELVKPGDLVKTLEGTHEVVRHFDNGIQECKQVVLENGNVLVATDRHRVRVLTKDGTGLEWKEVEALTEDDYVVIDT